MKNPFDILEQRLNNIEGILLDIQEKQTKPPTEKIYTRAEVIEKFDVCETTLWRWQKLGILHGKKVGNRLYFAESEIKDLVKRNGSNNE